MMITLPSVFLALKNFIMLDPRARYELANLWIYHEFLAEESYRERVEQEFLEGEELSDEQMMVNNSYNESLLTLLRGFKERLDTKDKYGETIVNNDVLNRVL